MEITKLNLQILLVFFSLILEFLCDQTPLPPGYYAFETASRRHGVPPRVRPPPYLPTNVPCSGVTQNSFMYSPKDTLCGDLNKGFIPRNPIGQHIHDQPYPFELIKNKTLHFLARALPFLKDDMDSIPKVVKLSKPDRSSSQKVQNPDSTLYDHIHVKKRSIETKNSLSGLLSGNSNSSLTEGIEGRQKPCESKDGLMCQIQNALGGNSVLSQAVQVLSAAQTAANTAQHIGSLASLLHHFSSSSSSQSPPSQDHKSLIAQLASAIGGSPAASEQQPAVNQQPLSSGTSNFNPVLAVLDYLASNSQEKSGVSSILPARRKKPMDLEELASEAASSLAAPKAPPTPCPSLEEYIAPVFARNYQGVWKYIVQIPHEGYFTQTVQKTSCMKGKCDFMEGSCHESPRWVSLLVAEIFYPDARFPNPVPMSSPTSRFDSPNTFSSPQSIVSQSQEKRSQLKQSPSNLHPAASNIQRSQFATPVSQQPPNWRSSEESFEAVSGFSSSVGARRMKRQSSNSAEDDGNDIDKKPSDENQCDGVDKIGCYTVRVYYDWFLVPGSCKCWKKTTQGGLDALKKIFIGK